MQKKINNWIICMIMAVILAAGLIACSNDEPVRIGFIAGLSGRVADLGVAGRNGVMLAVEQKNASGGIHGRSIELIVRDDQQNPDMAKKGVQSLLDQKVELIIGPMTSSMAMTMLPLVNLSNVYMISPTVTTTDLLGKDDHFLRVISTTRDYATKNAEFQISTLGHKKAVVIYDLANRAYTQSWLNDFKKAYENLGGIVLKVKPFESGNDAVFYDHVNELLQEAPDLFVVISNAVDAALICQQVRKIDTTVGIAMSEWASTERYIELSGAASEGVYVTQFLDRNDESDRYQSFRKAYVDRFGQEPGFAGVAGYDAGLVAFDALSSQKKDESIKDTIIRRKTYQCVQQTIIIDQYGDANRKTFITKIKDGKYQTIE